MAYTTNSILQRSKGYPENISFRTITLLKETEVTLKIYHSQYNRIVANSW